MRGLGARRGAGVRRSWFHSNALIDFIGNHLFGLTSTMQPVVIPKRQSRFIICAREEHWTRSNVQVKNNATSTKAVIKTPYFASSLMLFLFLFRFQITNHALEFVRRAVAVVRARVLCKQFDTAAKWVRARNQNTPSTIARIAIAATAVREARMISSWLISCLLASGKYQVAARIPLP